MKQSLLVLVAVLLSSCAANDKPENSYTYSFDGARLVYLQVPPVPEGCVTRVYPITRHMLPYAMRDCTDWKEFLRYYYGLGFPRGGFALYINHELIIADTEVELGHFAYLFSPPRRLTAR